MAKDYSTPWADSYLPEDRILSAMGSAEVEVCLAEIKDKARLLTPKRILDMRKALQIILLTPEHCTVYLDPISKKSQYWATRYGAVKLSVSDKPNADFCFLTSYELSVIIRKETKEDPEAFKVLDTASAIGEFKVHSSPILWIGQTTKQFLIENHLKRPDKG